VRPSSKYSEALVPEVLLAEWVHGDLPPEAVPELAVEALSRGCDTPTLRRLAGERQPCTRGELDRDVLQCFRELGLRTPEPGEARVFLVNQWALLVAERKVEPYRGSKRIWLLSSEWWGKPEWDRLSVFVGLASEWEDYPPGRAEMEAAMVSEAQKLLDEGGLQVVSGS
jgi:hypothetical protein